jgi:predicted HAD superfamily phosphohydrolase YqeG
MVGDKQDADILFGQNAGYRTLLVLSDRLISLVFEFPLTLK